MGSAFSVAAPVRSMASQGSGDSVCTCDPLWYLDFYELPPYLKPPPRILELPDELLLSIATKLEKNSDLRRLSLVNQKLRHISQEALVREVILPRNGILQFLSVLCNRPDLVSKITSLDVGDVFDRATDPGNIRDLDKENLYRKCQTLVDSINGSGYFSRIIKAIKKDDNAFGKVNHRYFFDILIALSPNMKNLTIRLPERSEDEFVQQLSASEDETEQPSSILPFQGPALYSLQKRLRDFTISETSTWWRSLKMHNVSLRSFTQLVRLSIPMDALIKPDMTAMDLVEALPPSLEYLQIRPCNKLILLWLPDLGRAHLDAKFPRLRHLDLCFKSCLRSSLLLIDQGRDALTPFHGVIRLLAQTGLIVETYNGPSKNPGTLFDELEAWSCLSDFERWLTATMNQQFSSSVARTEGGALRRKAKQEVRCFLRGHKTPASLRKTSRFKPCISLDETVQLSFGKQKRADTDESATKLDVEAWTKLRAIYRMENIEAITKGASNLLNDTIMQKEAKFLEYDFTIFERTLRVPEPCLVSKFDLNEWMEVEFFSKLKPISKSAQVPLALQMRKRGRKKNTLVAIEQRSSTPRPRRAKKVA